MKRSCLYCVTRGGGWGDGEGRICTYAHTLLKSNTTCEEDRERGTDKQPEKETDRRQSSRGRAEGEGEGGVRDRARELSPEKESEEECWRVEAGGVEH